MLRLSLIINLKAEKKKIIEIGESLVLCFREFGIFDSRFLKVYAIGRNSDFLIEVLKDNAGEELANVILDWNKKDIKKFDKEKELDISFERPYGFGLSCYVKDEMNRKLVALSFKIGSVDSPRDNKISNYNIKEVENFSYSWYMHFFSAFINYLDVETAFVLPTQTMDFFNLTKQKYQFPVGWITYLSNEYSSIIPIGIKNLIYETQAKGVFFILTKEQFNENDLIYKANTEKLYTIMEEIAGQNPDYCKKNNSL